MYQLQAACRSDTGHVRTNNEDSYFFNGIIADQEKTGGGQKDSVTNGSMISLSTFAVFDGMGGEALGEIASHTAAQGLMADYFDSGRTFIEPRVFLEECIQHMNDQVCRKEEETKASMGTTAVILHFCGDQVYVCNIGDSKAFRLREHEFFQISEDHTDADSLKKHGVTRRKPSLTQYIGIPQDDMILEPHIAKAGIRKNDKYLLSSDGLTDMLSNIEICEILENAKSAVQCATLLTERALQAGGRDNITVLVVFVE